ncbi:FecCD family ABC transporter permease [Marinicellulosiphila megalodicopiae]|uniref:FecCD family ABC transporter permease n=1 Tax=Marinicellulosiphila megalodicopiae TaxID=2724896 RepID=UPI003BAF6CC7
MHDSNQKDIVVSVMQSRLLKFNIHLIFFILLAIIFIGCLCVGNQYISPLQSMLGLIDQANFKTNFIIGELRFPRVLAAVVIGSTLALSGCLIQLVARNKLANPEYLGITDGAIFALMIFIVTSATAQLGPWWVAPFGAILTSVTLLLLTGRSDKSGYKFIMLGIGVSALIRALNDLMLATTDLQHASAIFLWSLGSLNAVEFKQLWGIGITLIAITPVLFFLQKKLPMLNFHTDTARSLGVSTNLLQFILYFIALMLASFSVSVAGPIAFLALIAPIIATGIIKPPAIALVLSMLIGAIILLIADTIARTVLPNEIPAGIMTTLIGGPLLLFILLKK